MALARSGLDGYEKGATEVTSVEGAGAGLGDGEGEGVGAGAGVGVGAEPPPPPPQAVSAAATHRAPKRLRRWRSMGCEAE